MNGFEFDPQHPPAGVPIGYETMDEVKERQFKVLVLNCLEFLLSTTDFDRLSDKGKLARNMLADLVNGTIDELLGPDESC